MKILEFLSSIFRPTGDSDSINSDSSSQSKITLDQFVQEIHAQFGWHSELFIRHYSGRGSGDVLFSAAWSVYQIEYKKDGTWFYAARGSAGAGSNLREAIAECTALQSNVWRAEFRLKQLEAEARLKGENQ